MYKRVIFPALVGVGMFFSTPVAFAEKIKGECDLTVLFGNGSSSVSGTFELNLIEKRLVLFAGENLIDFSLQDLPTLSDEIVVGFSPAFDGNDEANPGVYTAVLDRGSGLLDITFTALGRSPDAEFAGLSGKCFRNLL